jgi:hypothetical protein
MGCKPNATILKSDMIPTLSQIFSSYWKWKRSIMVTCFQKHIN